MSETDDTKVKGPTNEQETEIAFPERIEYVISGEEALVVIQKALDQIKGFRESQLFLFKTLIGPLVPENIRRTFEEHNLNNVSIAYDALVNGAGNLVSFLAIFGLDEQLNFVKEQQRFIILPFIEMKLKEKIKQLETQKPFGWKITRKFYQRNVNAIGAVIDNMVNLLALAWTFCPGIGEPEKETGFYNRFVFTGNGGFIDLGHYFNCAIIAYLYGTEKAIERAEKTEVRQRWLREREWLVKMKERHLIQIVTNLLWGYATSADTIEDRASDHLGLLLGEYMRAYENNGKVIDYFVKLYPKLVRKSLKIYGSRSTLFKIFDSLGMFFKNLFFTVGNGEVVDIKEYMTKFFDEYDAVDPHDSSTVPKFLIKSIIDFYYEKYSGEEWDAYTCKKWWVVIPQDLWERVVRGRKKFKEKALPIKIQLKESGKLVDPYPGDPPR
ncbi:MAG: hypothetical protein JSV88_01090 [Candidatus Aminicenantes bacterium]|nr:MAG: hypothetical protein JSV88_01090 [Candidatus Aminicenantes bacterium]